MAGVNYAYTYDANGNILTANIGGVTHSYTYRNSVWKDLLTAYDGQTITYDDIGNPLSYLNGMTFTWQNGRELTTMTKDGVTTTYTYNADGGRYTKTVGDTVTQYYYLGGKLYAETTGNNTIVYLYDETGTPYGFTLNGTKYYYEYNLMGDVIGLFDTTGTRVVRYYYTPYGDLASMVDNTTTGVGSINPIRYRGYYYDTETGFYYCGSRYYDPEIGRWINADSAISGVGGYVLGYNMFAYCFNNPINMIDINGDWPTWLAALGAAALAEPTPVLEFLFAGAVLVYAFSQLNTQTQAPVLYSPIIIIEQQPSRETSPQKDTKPNLSDVITTQIPATPSNDKKSYSVYFAYYQKSTREIIVGAGISLELAATYLAAGMDQSFMCVDYSTAERLTRLWPDRIYEIDRGKEEVPGYYYHFHRSAQEHGNPHIWHY